VLGCLDYITRLKVSEGDAQLHNTGIKNEGKQEMSQRKGQHDWG
jgi:hypothetical protein